MPALHIFNKRAIAPQLAMSSGLASAASGKSKFVEQRHFYVRRRHASLASFSGQGDANGVYASLVPAHLITVAETPLFVRQAADVCDEGEHADFVNFIAANPEAGDVIPETGGVRKVRWGRSGSGKRGGARVIYFYHDGARPLYLLLYAKARRENLTPDEKHMVRKLAAVLKR